MLTPKRPPSLRRWIHGSLLLAAVRALAADPPTTLPFTIAKDTTCITAPLKPDGTPDYIAALNAQFSAGVTPQNNLFVAWAETCDQNADSIAAISPTLYDLALATAGAK